MKKFIVFLGVLASFLGTSVTAQENECLPYNERIDCHPNPTDGDMATVCRALGCTFCDSDFNMPNVPTCFLPKNYGYRMEGNPIETSDGFRVTLRRASTNISMFGDDAESLTLVGEFQSNYRLRIKITDNSGPRFEVPLRIDPPQGGNANPLYTVEFSNDPVFSFKVIRKSSGTVIFDTSLGGFTYSNQFLQLTTRLPNTQLFGIGENEQNTFRHHFDGFPVYPLFATGDFPDGNNALYGVHPYYTVLENDGNAHSVIFVNSNAQEFVVLPSPGLLYRTIGGILDVYIFLGPTPENTVQQYTEAIGRTAIPPYWSLGYQLCRYGYDTLENMQKAVERTAQYGIPHDVQYGDIDIMDRNMDFTISEDRFGGLPQYVKELKAKGIKFMTILDPAIATGEPAGTYRPYDWGNELDVWVKRPDGNTALGIVWPPTPVAFPDFAKNTTRDWWITLIKEFHQVLEWDALWIDMNEPANFVNGDSEEGCAENKWNNPPYVIKFRGGYLPRNTLCMDHVDSVGKQYDTHTLYGWYESEPTLAGVQAARPGKRGFVLSRSNYVGTGRWVSHWLGDNYSRWNNLKPSIIGVLQFNHFGIPFVGPDICGHQGDAPVELCQRWQELGAFYPFSRNHNANGQADQDPGAFGPAVAESTRKALEIRYTLLPHLYTLFYLHSTRGDTVARALWHEFPTDAAAVDVDAQFLWGSGFMVSPVLDEGATTVNIYFPESRWFDYYTGTEVNARRATISAPAPLDFINLHMRGGVIYPTQEPAINTELSRQNPLGLTVGLDDNNRAEGQLYYDDGELLDPVQSGRYYLARYIYENGQLETIVENNGWLKMSELVVDSVRLLGTKENITGVKVNGQVVPSAVVTRSASNNGEVIVKGLKLNPTINSKITFY